MRLLWWLSFRLESWALGLQNWLWLNAGTPPGPRLSGLKIDPNLSRGPGLEAWLPVTEPNAEDYVIRLWPTGDLNTPANRFRLAHELRFPADEDGNPLEPFIDEATFLRLLDDKEQS